MSGLEVAGEWKRSGWRGLWCVVAAVWMVGGAAGGLVGGQENEGQVAAALWWYQAQGQRPCFAGDFLRLAAYATGLNIRTELVEVELGSPRVFQYPFAVLSGQGELLLTEEEQRNLKAFLERGGFLLASAECSDAAWAEGFRRLMERLFGDSALVEVGLEHPILRQGVYRIDRIATWRAEAGRAIEMMRWKGRVAVVFSAAGLNATDEAGGGCCCCGANEIRNARYINANILVYALTH